MKFRTLTSGFRATTQVPPAKRTTFRPRLFLAILLEVIGLKILLALAKSQEARARRIIADSSPFWPHDGGDPH